MPDVLYYLPENFGKIDCLVELSNQQVDEIKVHCEMEEPAEIVYLKYFQTMINDLGLAFPRKEEAFLLF